MNGQDSNSPIITGNDAVAQSGSTIPDNEDLNADNTLTELEEYYEYDMDLKPGQLDIGKEYIVDHIQTDDQGRIPQKVIGTYSGFPSENLKTGLEQLTVSNPLNMSACC